MSFIQRRRQLGSWLALILGTAGTSSATSGEDASDSESHNSHRSTAADFPPASDTPVLTESYVQTETVSDDPLIVRAKKAQTLLRDVVEVVDEPWIPKRIKVRDFAHVYQTKAAKLKVPNVSAFDPKIHPVVSNKSPNVHRPAEKAEEGTTETAPVSKPISKSSAVVSPPQFSDPPTGKVSQTALQPPAAALPQTVAKPAIASSFFVAAREVAADEFIDDSGFVAGEDDESDQSEDELPPPSANPFFNSGSLFTGGNAPNPFLQPPDSKPIPAFGGSSLFAGAPFSSTSPFSSQSLAENPFLQKANEPAKAQKLFAFSNPSGSEKNGQKD